MPRRFLDCPFPEEENGQDWCPRGRFVPNWSRNASAVGHLLCSDLRSVRTVARLAVFVTLPACSLHPLPDQLIIAPTELIARIEGEPIDSFIGEARLEYYGEGKARKGKLVVMSQPPADLRMEVLSFTDDLISVLVVNSAGFKYFQRGEKKCFTGPLCAAPLISMFPLISSPSKLLPLLQGKAPLLPDPDERKLSFSRQEGVYVLEVSKGGTKQIVKVRNDCRSVAGIQMWKRGELVAEFTFEGTINAGASDVPRRVRLRAPGLKADLSIEYREAKLGYRFEGDPFTFQCPEGTEVEELDCGIEW